jgi:hypothetical protein
MQTLMNAPILADFFWDIVRPWQLIMIVVLVVVIIVLMKIRNKQM